MTTFISLPADILMLIADSTTTLHDLHNLTLASKSHYLLLSPLLFRAATNPHPICPKSKLPTYRRTAIYTTLITTPNLPALSRILHYDRNPDWELLLITALFTGSLPVLKTLLEHPRLRIHEETTLLHSAVRYLPDAIPALVKKGVDVDVKERGCTALHIAAISASGEAVRVLIECGADVEAEDWAGRTALGVARSAEVLNRGRYQEVIGMLEEAEK